MPRARFMFVVAVLAASGCGKTTTKDSPETLSKLADCESRAAKLAEKDKLIQSYEAEISRLKMASGEQTYTFAIDGTALTIKARPQGGGGGGGVPGIDDKTAAELSQKFIDVVNKSRPAIQKCYEQALKKNTSLQARTISLRVSTSFNRAGDQERSTFQPDLGGAFDACMKGIAGRWKLPAAAQGVTFQATVSLSPT